ncbi:MAG: hypothetical protein HY727_01565 [Candidatus Rokubacteria bacterium]|nr:hypothetical protein [Candidatus Rokubacteria bacterium]
MTATEMDAEPQRTHRCPYCGGISVRRSTRRSFFERLVLRVVQRRPYACLDCGKRFWARLSGAAGRESID